MSLSRRSETSISSIGIGSGTTVPRAADPEGLVWPRLSPEGQVPGSQYPYDCIVYLVHCETHDRIAVVNANRAIWLPFVALADNLTWQLAAVEGLRQVMGRREAEMDARGCGGGGRLPNFDLTLIHVARVQISSERIILRLSYLVTLKPTEGFGCCERIGRLSWPTIDEILHDGLENVWGPEVKISASYISTPKSKIFHEYSLERMPLALLSKPANFEPCLTQLVKSAKITAEQMLLIFEDYLDHCFPSLYMSLESFKAYLIRFGFAKTDQRFPWLFTAMRFHGKGFLDFTEFFVGLLCMEPNTEHVEARIKMIFRYYDLNQDQALDVNEIVGLVEDLNPRTRRDNLKPVVDQTLRVLPLVERRLTYEGFESAVRGNILRGTEKLCRAPRPLLPQIRQSVKLRAEERATFCPGNTRELVRRRPEKGICNACRAQKYDFGTHCVSFDTFGRCVKPLRMKEMKRYSPEDTTYSLERYSAEFVFGVGSICKMFFDVISDAYRKNQPNPLLTSTPPEEMVRYVRSLCADVCELVVAEDRLMKINAPAVVCGDLWGNLDSLFTLEETLWQSAPVLPYNLVFLGNFSGPGSTYGKCSAIETVCYLLALKMLSPNKVFLLRGTFETRDTGSDLQAECIQRYGQEVGKVVFESLHEVFDRLPLALLVDESIVLLHSGLPRSVAKLDKLAELPDVLSVIDPHDTPAVYEILMHTPTELEGDEMQYTASQFQEWIRVNHVTHVIRSHDQGPSGFYLHFGGRCITVSSVDSHNLVVGFIDGHSALVRLVKIAHKIAPQAAVGRMQSSVNVQPNLNAITQ